LKSTNLDSEWLYRKLWPAVYGVLSKISAIFKDRLYGVFSGLAGILTPIARRQSYELLMPWSVRAMSLIVMAVLTFMLLILYIFK
jgi:hypothetical protein